MRDSEKLLRLIKENQIIAITIGVLVVIAVVYFVVFVPLIRELGTKYMECRLCESGIFYARSLISYASHLDTSYGERVLVSEKEAAEGLDEFTNHGKSLGIDFIFIKPKEIIAKGGVPYKILPIELEIKATDKQFVDFMGSIDELKKAIITVNSFDITPDKQDRTLLEAKVVINLYLSTKSGPS